MRRFSSLAILAATALLSAAALPALAQEPPKDEHPPAHHARLTWQEHFDQANLAHDGHLTAEEAKAGYPTVARHFKEIDADGKGYVTQNDLQAWRALRKAARPQPREPQDALRPRNAFRLTYPDQKLLKTTVSHTLAQPPDIPREAASSDTAAAPGAPAEPQ